MRTLTLTTVMLLAWSLGASAQAPPAQAPPPCTPGELRSAPPREFVCGLRAPEDLVALPGSQWVVAGAYAGGGGIFLIRVADRMTSVAYPSATARDRFDAKTYAACPGPPDAAAKAKFQTR